MSTLKISAALLSLLLLAGCSGTASDTTTANGDTSANSEEEATETIEVDEGLLTVDITFPASFVNMGGEEMTQEKVEGLAKENGYLSGKLNEDGSVTYSMTKLKQQEMLDSAKKSFDDSIKQTLADYPTVKSVTRSDDFSEIKIEISEQDMSTGFLGLGFSMSAYFYQLLDGREFATEVVYVDANTGEEISRTAYPLSE